MARTINIGDLHIGTTSPRLEDVTLTPKTTEETYKSENAYGYDEVTVEAVTSDIDPNIKAENIMDGVSILGVEGEMVGLQGQTKTITPSTTQQTITPDEGYNGITEITVEAVTSDIDSDIKAENIKQGVEILGVAGNVVELKGETKTITPTTAQQTITPSSGKNGMTEVTVSAVDASIDPDIQASNIKQGVDILGVTGNVVELNGQVKIANPSTSAQTIRPDANKNAITEVTVNPVTSSIDNNIQAGNIKSGVSILGVNGNVTELVGQTKSVTPTSQVQTITPDQGYNGLTEVTVGASQGDPSDYFYTSKNVATNSTNVAGWIYGIKKVVIGSLSGTLNGLFKGYMGEEIVGLENVINTSKVNGETLAGFFNGCSGLKSLDFTNCNTSNATSFYNMFSNCSNLRTLDLSSFVTSSVTNMSSMFNSCSLLESVNLSSFVTSSVTNMNSMFARCYALKSIDLSNFTTTAVTNIGALFFSCNNLESVNLSSFNTSTVTDMSSMFYNCNKLTTIDIHNFTIESCTNIGSMFNNCASLQHLNISGMDFGTYGSNITSYNAMFQNVPTTCEIWVKNQAAKDWLESKFGTSYQFMYVS